MEDIKTVMSWLEGLTDDDWPHFHSDSEVQNIAKSAMELLKEQEAVKPIAKEDDTYECICSAVVGWDELDANGMVQMRFNYCPFCGRVVKWE